MKIKAFCVRKNKTNLGISCIVFFLAGWVQSIIRLLFLRRPRWLDHSLVSTRLLFNTLIYNRSFSLRILWFFFFLPLVQKKWFHSINVRHSHMKSWFVCLWFPGKQCRIHFNFFTHWLFVRFDSKKPIKLSMKCKVWSWTSALFFSLCWYWCGFLGCFVIDTEHWNCGLQGIWYTVSQTVQVHHGRSLSPFPVELERQRVAAIDLRCLRMRLGSGGIDPS